MLRQTVFLPWTRGRRDPGRPAACRPPSSTRRALAYGCLAVCLLMLAGCGQATGTVEGKVTFRGKPLSQGSIMFFCEDGHIVSGLLSPDGSFSVPEVPVGPARVALVTHPPVPKGFQLPQRLPPSRDAPQVTAPDPSTNLRLQGNYVVLPEKYSTPEHSRLVVEVSPGSQWYDIDLTP